MAIKTKSNDIVNINNNITFFKEKNIMAISKITKAPKSIPSTDTAKTEVKAPEVKTAKAPEVKVEKKDIDLKTLTAPKGITVTAKSSCIIFQNEKGVKWYLKGHTMEVTTAKGLEKRAELLSKERLESGRMGKIIGMIRKVQDNQDINSILSHLLLATPTAKKEVKKVEINTPTTSTPTPQEVKIA